MDQKSLPALAEEVANRVRSLQREKREVSAKSARNAAPDAEILGGNESTEKLPNQGQQQELGEQEKLICSLF